MSLNIDDIVAELARTRLRNEELARDKERLESSNEKLASRTEKLESSNEQLERSNREYERTNREYERTNRHTTIDELLEACHTQLFAKLHVIMDQKLTTRGSITNPVGKSSPRFLKKWTDFPNQHSETWESIYSALNQDRKFTNLNYFQSASRFLRSTIASEDDLKDFQHRAVEDFVSEILNALGHDVSFHNQSHSLSEGADDVQERRADQSTRLPPVPEPRKADQICIRKTDDDCSEVLMVIEYKAPHKLTQSILTLGLDTEIDVRKIRDEAEVFKGEKKTEYEAKWLAAAAASQTYDYMLKSGAMYSCIVTGESIVFLWFDMDEPDTLYYHLALPRLEVYSEEDPDTFLHPYTAIGYLATFCQMASHARPLGEDWRKAAVGKADAWIIDMEKRLEQLTAEVKEKLQASPKYSPFYARIGPLLRSSPVYTRSKGIAQRAKAGCKPDQRVDFNHDNDHDDDPSGGPGGRSDRVDHTPTKTWATRQAERRERESKPSSSRTQQQRPYCTHACLLGIVRRSSIDEDCPNAALHPRYPRKQGSVHILTKQKFCDLVRLQLATTMDKDIKDLRLQGARSMIFYITLASYGYTLIGKATIDVFIPDLLHEASIYRRLRKLQGLSIPVHLGNINLVYPWYEFDFTITHMLLVSYAGRSLTDDEYYHDHCSRVIEIGTELLRLGVLHADVRPENVLWSEELKRVLLIDFERSRICTPVERHYLGLRAKRARQDSATEAPTTTSEDATIQLDLPWEESNEDLVFPVPSPAKTLPPLETTTTTTTTATTTTATTASDAENSTMKMPVAVGEEKKGLYPVKTTTSPIPSSPKKCLPPAETATTTTSNTSNPENPTTKMPTIALGKENENPGTPILTEEDDGLVPLSTSTATKELPPSPPQPLGKVTGKGMKGVFLGERDLNSVPRSAD
ncbi:MAG: hypothetical protein LQ346_005099 [Caloplaca aetnensis]|nr:MAG: hypothetical protein LQ346_005099 [Caloplaca aetnensis]